MSKRLLIECVVPDDFESIEKVTVHAVEHEPCEAQVVKVYVRVVNPRSKTARVRRFKKLGKW